MTDAPTTKRDTQQQEIPAMPNIPTTAKHDSPTTAKRDAKAMLDQYMSTRKRIGTGNGRLLFALDATASRQETWNTACRLQADMFRQAGAGLSVSLCYFRGADEFKATGWVTSGESLVRPMLKLEVQTGLTQIRRVLSHALRQHAENPIAAVTYVGDACEENVEELAGLASELGALKLPAFMFLEGEPGSDLAHIGAEDAFRLIAAKSGGAFFWFGIDSPKAVAQFADTLNAVAKLAVGDASAVAAIAHNK
jgi:hypothetical protein